MRKRHITLTAFIVLALFSAYYFIAPRVKKLARYLQAIRGHEAARNNQTC